MVAENGGFSPSSFKPREFYQALLREKIPLQLYGVTPIYLEEFAGAMKSSSPKRAREIPLVWNLAGGYQRTAEGGISPVIDLHLNTRAGMR